MRGYISSIDGLLVRDSGPWIHRKYFFLKRYMYIFTQGMKAKWQGRLTYIDLFAGPGRCLIRDTNSEVDGSPLIALGYEFSEYIFVEEDPENLRVLRQRCSKSPKHKSIQIVEGDCNAVIGKVVPEGLSLAFIDPTGIDIHFETIRQLTSNRRVDLLMTVQFGMDMKRNFEQFRKQGSRSKLWSFLGGDVNWSAVRDANTALGLFKERVKGLGYKAAEFREIVVRNMQRNVPMYFLFFASKNPRGIEFWHKITARDETGQYQLEFF
ncbi:MAG: three-Cys-motif partner protein TcmP [Candidatus Omnitrophota bacterium]|nr:three-Cys-motif partner protein TcmP [Candidatus Omnitrophota bacterium]